MSHDIGAGHLGNNMSGHLRELDNAILQNQDQYLGAPDGVPDLAIPHPPDHTGERVAVYDQDSALDIARRLHQSGQLQAAEKAYLALLEVRSKFIDRLSKSCTMFLGRLHSMLSVIYLFDAYKI